jgi:hypothetical protein
LIVHGAAFVELDDILFTARLSGARLGVGVGVGGGVGVGVRGTNAAKKVLHVTSALLGWRTVQ